MPTDEAIRQSLIERLEWNDANGTYSDADCDLEELDRWTLGDAVKLVRDMASEDGWDLRKFCEFLKLDAAATEAVINGQA